MRYEVDLDTSGHTFTWSVPKRGYALVEGERRYALEEVLRTGGDTSWVYPGRKGLIFVSQAPPIPERAKTAAEIDAWRQEHISVYAPKDRADLHRAFALVPHRAEDALQFVNRHGLIGRSLFWPYLDDFFAAQKLISDVLELVRRRADQGSKVEAVINRNHEHFFLRVSALSHGRLLQSLVPASLLGWMLLQAMRELTGVTWRDCKVCGTPFEVRDERQGRKLFCSERCRQKSFRDKRRQ